MKHILTKYSSKGFKKVFDTEYDARQELLSHICGLCLKGGSEQYLDDKGNWVTYYYKDEIPDIHSIDDLLGTACGCEFGYEEVGE